VAAVALIALVVSRTPSFVLGSGPPPSFAPVAAGTEVLVGAGDIARCDFDADEATARLLDAIEGTVFTTGDNAYPRGSSEDFAQCYDASWGRHIDRTRFPVAGNHEWETAGASGYLEYFGDTAQPDGTTWYAATVGAWRLIVLDSNCAEVAGCVDGSEQLQWLRAELRDNPSECTLALWHHPRWSTGRYSDDPRTEAFWRELHAAGAELVLNGHEHHYERFAALTPDGAPDPEEGVTQITVGTGGAPLRDFVRESPNTEARADDTYGVLRLELSDGAYAWWFVPVAGQSFTDSGTGRCH
jgi:alkaline phosphatase